MDTLVEFVGLIKTFGRLPRFMNFLYQMCGSPDRPVLKNQNMLISILMKDPNSVFFKVRAPAHGVLSAAAWMLTNEILGFTFWH